MPETIPEPKSGDSIKSWAIRITREVARLARLMDVDGSSGLVITGSSLRAVRGKVGEIRTVQTPSGGIAAFSGSTAPSAVCTFYVTSGATQTLGTETATVYNDIPAAIPGSRKTKVHWEGNAWRFLVQSCT